MTSVNRTITHMLSGQQLGGGIAYIGALCNSSYGYGVSANLSRTTVDCLAPIQVDPPSHWILWTPAIISKP